MQLSVKATQGERHRHKEKDGGEGGRIMALTSGKGHSITILLTIANKERIRQYRGIHSVVCPSTLDGGG